MAWLAGYAYRVLIPCSFTTAGLQTNYTKQIAIVQGAGSNGAGVIYLNSHALNWPNDIRFTKADGTTLLDFYREESDGTDGTWHVELDSIAASGDTNFYLYYGKASDSDASNLDNTFIFGDNFESGNLSKWTAQSRWAASLTDPKYGTYCAAGSPGATNTMMYAELELTNIAIKFWIKASGVSNYRANNYCEDASYLSFFFLSQNNGSFQYWNGTAYANLPAAKSYSAGTWYRIEIALDFTNKTYRWLYVVDGDAGSAAMKSEDNTDPDTRFDDIVIRNFQNAAGPTKYVDEVLIRKYVYPEPAWATPGSEESSVVPASIGLVGLGLCGNRFGRLVA